MSALGSRPPVPDAPGIAGFVGGPGIERLDAPSFDIGELRSALSEVLARIGYDDTYRDSGFGTLPVTRRPGTSGFDPVDISGQYWLRPDETYEEVARDPVVDEHGYTELLPEFAGTYFEHVVTELRSIGAIGRTRLNLKEPFNVNSFHRDPEPRVHIPIHTNPGCMFVVNHHVTHLPADGSTCYTDTRGYHTAFNGGDTDRVHLVAAVLGSP